MNRAIWYVEESQKYRFSPTGPHFVHYFWNSALSRKYFFTAWCRGVVYHLTGEHNVEVKYSVTMNRATWYIEASQKYRFSPTGPHFVHYFWNSALARKYFFTVWCRGVMYQLTGEDKVEVKYSVTMNRATWYVEASQKYRFSPTGPHCVHYFWNSAWARKYFFTAWCRGVMHHLTGEHKVEVKYSVTMNRATWYVEASQKCRFSPTGPHFVHYFWNSALTRKYFCTAWYRGVMYQLLRAHEIKLNIQSLCTQLHVMQRRHRNTDFRLPGHISSIISEIVHWPENISLLFGAGEWCINWLVKIKLKLNTRLQWIERHDM